MKQIGYSLIDEMNAEVETYGGMPAVLYLPNGDQVHAPVVGEMYGNRWRLVERWLIDEPPGPLYAAVDEVAAFDGTKIIVTVVYESTPTLPPPVPSPVNKTLFDHENRIRTGEGLPPLTLDEFLTKMEEPYNGST
jgi:hypothetical protein